MVDLRDLARMPVQTDLLFVCSIVVQDESVAFTLGHPKQQVCFRPHT
jgi:hypothetical protein